MITVLLEQIIQLLKGWIDSFNNHAEVVEDSLTDLNNTASDIELNTDPIPEIRDNTGAIITPITQIKTNTDSIKTDVTQIKTDTGIIKNNANSIATSAGAAAAFAEDCATNTLDIVDKVTTIASDTTQIRADQITLDNDLDKIYEAIKWSCVNTIMTETESGASPLSFDTDIADDLVSCVIDINATQTGTPSPATPATVTGYSTANVVLNGNTVSISLGTTVYFGELNVTTGELTIKSAAYQVDNSTGISNFISSAQYGSFGRVTAIGQQIVNVNSINAISDMAYGIPFADRIVNPERDRIFTDENGWINLRASNTQTITSASDLKSYFMGANIYYDLLTPIVTQLTAQQLSSIIGDNVISTNTNGNIEVTYKESVKHYLDKQQ